MNHSWNAEQFQSHLESLAPAYKPELWPTWLVIVGIGIIAMLAVLALHALLRYRLAPAKKYGHEHKAYLYPFAVRLWHWTNAFLFIVLLLSGLLNHFAIGTYLIMATLVQVHAICGYLLMASWVGFVLINAYGGNGHHYVIRFKGWIGRCIKQARYYLVGIMRGEPHPFEANEQSKFNPLQQAAYTGVMYMLVPLLLFSGFFCLYPTLGLEEGVGYWMLKLHFVLALASMAFIFGHLYLCTTGDTPTTSFKSMIDGYHRHKDIKSE